MISEFYIDLYYFTFLKYVQQCQALNKNGILIEIEGLILLPFK